MGLTLRLAHENLQIFEQQFGRRELISTGPDDWFDPVVVRNSAVVGSNPVACSDI